MATQENKIKFLAFKHRSLQEELKECKTIVAITTQEVYTMYAENFSVPSPNTANHETQDQPTAHSIGSPHKQEELLQSDPPTEPASEVKNIFRKIAFKTHPDKLENSPDHIKRIRSSLYQEASSAADDNDFLTLLDIAMKLDIPLPDFPESSMILVQEKIRSLKKEIDEVQSTLMWNWYFADKKETKDKILKKLFEIIYEERQKNNIRP